MRNFFSRFRIPTLLGMGIIIVGIIVGVFLVLREQRFLSEASIDVIAKEVNITNISDTEVTISYQTSSPISSFITFGQIAPSGQTVLDDRDANPAPAAGAGPQPHTLHYFTLKNLLPKTNYQYKIVFGKSSRLGKFQTAAPLTSQPSFNPVIGLVFDQDQPLDEGIAYLSIADATMQSAQVKSGNFLIPLSQIRKADLSDSFPMLQDSTVKLTIISSSGQANALFNLSLANQPLPAIKLGENLDLTTLTPQPSPQNQESIVFDLNSDGKINAADNSIVLDNFGKNFKDEQSSSTNKKADLNSDGKVDQKDLDLMAKQINQ